MPFREIYMNAFKNDVEYSQLVLHTAAVLQSNKFIQVMKQRGFCISLNGTLCRVVQWKQEDLLTVCVFLSSLSWPERMSWTNCEKRSRSSGRESKRKWWVDVFNIKWFGICSNY